MLLERFLGFNTKNLIAFVLYTGISFLRIHNLLKGYFHISYLNLLKSHINKKYVLINRSLL